MQIHYMEDGSVEIYSRNAERNTGKYPDVVSSVSRYACLIVIHASCYQGPPYRSIPAYQYPIDMAAPHPRGNTRQCLIPAGRRGVVAFPCEKTRWRLVPELEDEAILSLPTGERGVVSSPHGKTRQRPRPRARRRGVASPSHAGRRGGGPHIGTLSDRYVPPVPGDTGRHGKPCFLIDDSKECNQVPHRGNSPWPD
ncbi:hypothetical protein BHM03_00010713 [Ensete ventricosum]|nr:hypothetical protein BHM03_00010713 [Ensete ventricosum]